jgi:TP901 family phage tail tape measure protein
MTTVIGALRVTLGLDSSELMAGIASAQGDFKRFGAQMREIGSDLTMRVTAPLAAIGAGVLALAGGFEASMNRVGAATGASAEELTKLSDLARELGKSTTFSAGQAADAIEMLAKNGLDASKILGGALSASLDLAAAGGADLSSAADLTTDVLANFKKDVGDLKPVVDGVTGVLLQSKFGFEDYQLALAQAGGVAGGLGVTFEDFNAVIAATSPAFASGSDAGTSFKTFLQRLVPASDGAAEAMRELGLEFFDGQGNMKDMAAVAQELQDGLSRLSDEAKTEALSTIFGTDAMRTAIGLMDQGAAGVERLDAAIRSASATEQAKARTKGLLGALEQMKGAFEELALSIANSGLLEAATDAVKWVTDLVDRISELDPELLRLGTIFAGAAAAIGPILVGLGLFGAALAAISAPVLAAVAVVAALAAAAIPLYQNWEQIRAQFPGIAGAVENLGAAIGVLVQSAVENFKLMVQGIEQLLSGDFRGAFETGKEIVLNFGQTIVDTLSALLGELPAKFLQIGRDIMAGLMGGLRESWAGVKAWFSDLGDAIPQWVRDKLGIQSPSTVFVEIGGHIMQGLRQGLGSETGTIQAEMENFAQGLGQVFAGILFQQQDVGDTLKAFGLQTLGNLGGGLLSKGFGGLGAALKIPGFANGTDFAPGGLAMVGERGRELAEFPRGTRIHSNADTEALLRGARSREPLGVRLFVDRDGNWQAAVERIAGQQVEARRGAIVGDSVQAVQQGRAMSSRFLE